MYLLCLVRVDARRWRAFFLTSVVMALVELAGGTVAMTGLQIYLCRAGVFLVLAGVVAAYAWERKTYP